MRNGNTVNDIESIIARINDGFKNIDKTLTFFEKTHMVLREDIANEAALLNNINYYYGLFFERSDFMNYVLQKMNSYNLDYDDSKVTIDLIHALRTYIGHTLDKEKKQNLDIINEVERWCFKITGDKRITKANCEELTRELNERVNTSLININLCVQKIRNENPERLLQIKRELIRINDNSWSNYEIEEVCNTVFSKLEISLDPHIFVNKYAQKIKKKLNYLMTENADEQKNVIILTVEQILFGGDMCICPLSTDRIKEAFGVGNNSELGNLKRQAIDIFRNDIFLREEELLEKLKVYTQR